MGSICILCGGEKMDGCAYDGMHISYNQGYAVVSAPDHPNATTKGTLYLHQYIMSKHIGRPLKSDECVHHIDENKLNNSIHNLMLFATNSDHIKYHHAIKHGLEFTLHCVDSAYSCTIHHTRDKSNICPSCGNWKFDYSKLCVNCYHKGVHKHIPDRILLKQLIRTNTFVTIGKLYSVSDNAVRKWCKYYQLPYSKRVINKLNDVEWETL